MYQTQNPHRVAVIGSGISGLSTAYALLKAGFAVQIFESSEFLGGLASGFQDGRWDWPLERFYHHWFESDAEISRLIREFGVQDRLRFSRPATTFWRREEKKTFAFDNPAAVLRCPYLSWQARLRTGLALAYCRKTTDWRSLEKVSAPDWLLRWMGAEAFHLLWEPLLIAKFGEDYKEIPMSWFWARIASRTARLGYFHGGFQAFINLFAERIRLAGGIIRSRTMVKSVRPAPNGGFAVVSSQQSEQYSAVISTTSPDLMSQLAPDLPESYLATLRSMKSLAALSYIFALRRPLLQGAYWANIPAAGQSMVRKHFPFCVLVEHTNMIDATHYGGDHIVYCGDYLPAQHPHMLEDEDALRSKFISALSEFNQEFDHSWIRASWLFRARYAQPIPRLNHSRNIPDLRTPLRGLYLASMSQIYPWDRGISRAATLGRQAAELVIRDFSNRS